MSSGKSADGTQQTDDRGTEVKNMGDAAMLVRRFGDDSPPQTFYIDSVALDDIISDLIEVSNDIHGGDE